MMYYDRPTGSIIYALEVMEAVRCSRWLRIARPFIAIVAGFAVAVLLFAWIGATSPL